MPKPRPLLNPEAAKRTLAHRATRIADRLRQFNTRFGLRPRRVFLIWTKWSGAERGEGTETELARFEILPTPRVADTTAISMRHFAEGAFPDGSLRIDQISAGAVSIDQLKGVSIPEPNATSPRGSTGAPVAPDGDKRMPPNIDFFWEVVEDGRGDDPPARERFRLLSGPWRDAGGLQFACIVERASEDRTRDGRSQVDQNEDDELHEVT